MKVFSITLTSLFACFVVSAQSITPARNMVPRRAIRFKIINKDSVNLALNEDFDMIEDSCSQVIRYAHFNIRERKFFGPFKDISHQNGGLIITEGKYNMAGLKDGYFVTHYLNGDLQAKGNFKNNNYDGSWEMYYQDNKPKLTFEANGTDIKINNAWNAKGVKTVTDGKGVYRVDLDDIYWSGKLLNGKPDGTWRAMKTDDATNTSILTESYKNGTFQKGSGPLGAYTDAPRLVLVPADMLPFTRAELLHVSIVPCNGTKRKHIVNAQYRNGFETFSQYVKDAATPYINKLDIKLYEDELLLEGEVNDQGRITNLTSNHPFNDNIARGLIRQLDSLPFLEPATVDGKPVKQKFIITFKFSKGMYSFTYRFLPIQA